MPLHPTHPKSQLLCTVSLLIWGCAFLGAGEAKAQYSEYEIKASMIHSFAKFITWPDRMFDRENKIVLGILGDDPFGQTIDEVFKGRTVDGREWEIIRGAEVKDLKGSHVIFIGKSNELNIQSILEDIYSKRNASVLTIGDNIENFCQLGGMINYKSGSYVFDINSAALTNASLLVDVSLLKIASEIINYAKD